MRKILRTLALLVVLSILSTVLLTGCGTTGTDTGTQAASTPAAPAQSTAAAEPAAPAPSDEKVTITFTNFMASGDNAKYLTSMIDEFNKQFPNITVKSENVGYGDYFTAMQTRLAGGTAPEVYELNYENFVSYATQGVLADVTPYFAASQFDTSVLNEAALKAFQYEGKQYGLPETFSNVLLFYNKNLFDQAGIAYPTADWTWADEQKAAEKIRALGKNTFGIFHPVQTSEFFKTVQQNGGSLLSADKKSYTINTPENVATLEAMVNRIKSGVMPTPAQVGAAGDWSLFQSGRLGMIVTGVWAFPQFTKEIKDFKWDVQVEPGNIKKATHFFSNGLVLNKDSKLGAQAFEFAKFMSSSKEAAKIRIDANWELPPVTYPEILDAYKKVTPPDNKQAVFDSLQWLVTPLVIPNYQQFETILNNHLFAARDMAVTPAKALEDAQKELDSTVPLK